MLFEWTQSGLQAGRYIGVILNGGVKSGSCLLQYGQEDRTKHDGFDGKTSLGSMQTCADELLGKRWPSNEIALAKRLNGLSIASLLCSPRRSVRGCKAQRGALSQPLM